MAGRKCAEIKRNGAPSKNYAVNDSDRCFQHDPNSADEGYGRSQAWGPAQASRSRRRREVSGSADCGHLKTAFACWKVVLADTLALEAGSKRTRDTVLIVKASLDVQRQWEEAPDRGPRIRGDSGTGETLGPGLSIRVCPGVSTQRSDRPRSCAPSSRPSVSW